MEYSVIQVLLVFVVTFIAAIDQFSFLESLYQPIVTGMVVGLILGDVTTGLIVGGTYQLMTIGNMPIGGAQPPNAVVGGIMAAVRDLPGPGPERGRCDGHPVLAAGPVWRDADLHHHVPPHVQGGPVRR